MKNIAKFALAATFTARMVAAWQKAKGLKSDGRVGAGTWAKMRTVYCGYR